MGTRDPETRRLEIRLGARVETADGPVGQVTRVVVSPRERRIRALVVRDPQGREVLVPADRVADATEEEVRLALRLSDLDRLEPYRAGDHAPASLAWPGWKGLRSDGALLRLPGSLRRMEGVERRVEAEAEARPDESFATIRRGQRVLCHDGPIGQVDMVLVDAQTGKVQHLVIRRGWLFSRDVAVPADWVSTITPDAVILEASREAVAHLPLYRPDDELRRDVEEALHRDELLRVLGLPIRVEVEDGVVHLLGHVHNRALAARAEELTRSVPGVLGVENRLVVDLELLQQVSAALVANPKVRHLPVHVRVREGIVELTGSAPTLEDAREVERTVAALPGVRAVSNRLAAPGIPERWAWVVQPEVGQPVFATDVEVGRVEAVVLDPASRRVVGVVVHGEFPDAGAPPDAAGPLWERSVVIPLEQVERVTLGGVFLNVHAGAAAENPDLDPERYPPPPPDWTPPFPYREGDVRLMPERT
ncbi:MAG: BON domain-containing protein [Armatimonadota bacterium]|nr:BON domain-containing protein [Armatimonadota bacterium]MDR7444072.1 BON domain-containing protein [Armatimonadota bacterium]MDR7613521.1 BON domain-containing protein [Armatimonadota bacterium]